jgi:hypothetical protein
VQQLSTYPIAPQLKGTWQLFPAAALQDASTQNGVMPEHAAAFCQVPVELHVCGCVLDPHCV